MNSSTTGITAVVLTFNEETNLRECLAHLAWADETVVVDSGSTDGTLKLAKSMGARICQSTWRGFASQRNWALDNAEIETDWVLFVDADERITNDLRDEILSSTRSGSADAFYLCFKVILLGKWVKRSALYPVWHPRLLRRNVGRFKDSHTGHGETWEICGRIGYLREPYLHFSFSKGFTQWFEKHNRLSSYEAASAVQLISEVKWQELLSALFSRHPQNRRQALRIVSYHIPGWPFARFLYQLLARGGFLDGTAGWIYCSLYLVYEIMIRSKLAEVQSTRKGTE
jgi:glycosyltransferase involved in cell wall biosynthesis